MRFLFPLVVAAAGLGCGSEVYELEVEGTFRCSSNCGSGERFRHYEFSSGDIRLRVHFDHMDESPITADSIDVERASVLFRPPPEVIGSRSYEMVRTSVNPARVEILSIEDGRIILEASGRTSPLLAIEDPECTDPEIVDGSCTFERPAIEFELRFDLGFDPIP